ncbi:MAG: rubredoxin domain-containing protein [Bacteroidota bacterium]
MSDEQKELIRIKVKGGVLSPSELRKIIDMAERLGLKSIHFGSRQDILFPFSSGQTNLIQQFQDIKYEFLNRKKTQNISSSYVTADIFSSTSWLNGATYLYILEQFGDDPSLEINIVDPQQQIVPLFAAQLNFIASPEEDYWYLYLRLPNMEGIHCFPALIYTWDIALIARTIESTYEEMENIQELFEELNNELDTNNRTISQPLQLPFQAFPYYEGMNKMSIDKYWLGLYWRNNCYDLAFLKAMCTLCLDCKIGKICLTPWKSFIVKGIDRRDRLRWEKLLGKFGINVRHSSLELNWHLPLIDGEALALKQFIVRNFDQNDISTYGLTFSIKSSYGINFTSIVIEKNPQPKIVNDFQIRPTYNVLYCENFNPNSLKYLTYAQDVDKIELPGLLMELSQLYFEQLGEGDDQNELLPENLSFQKKTLLPEAWECQDCLSRYHIDLGDSFNGIEPGIAFEDLPETYECPVCGSPKSHFHKVQPEANGVNLQ